MLNNLRWSSQFQCDEHPAFPINRAAGRVASQQFDRLVGVIVEIRSIRCRCWSQTGLAGLEASVFRFLHSGIAQFGWTPVHSDGYRGGIR